MKTAAEIDEYLAGLSAAERMRLAEMLEGGGDLGQRLARRWENHRVLFVREAIGAEPTAYQVEILGMVDRHSRVSVRGPHGLGKTGCAAWLILHWAIVYDLLGVDWKVATTASAWRQLREYLWPEVKKWAMRLKWDMVQGIGPWRDGVEMLSTEIRGKYGSAFALASDRAELIEGAHADRLLYVFDEAKVIPRPTWEAAEGAFSGGAPKALAISTPPPAKEGVFYEIHARRPGYEEWRVRHVTKEECIAAGRMNAEWAEARRRQWGEDDPRYISRVLGEFPEGSDVKLIPLSWIEAAQERWRDWRDAGFPGDVDVVACDVSDGGADSTVIGKRVEECRLRSLEVVRRSDPMEVTGLLVQMGRRHDCPVVVDAVGAGSLMVARMREVGGLTVVAHKGSAGSDRTDISGENGFLNQRSASYWRLREVLDPSFGYEACLPPDPELEEELVILEWRPLSSGKIQVLPTKEQIVKDLGRSPDKGDAAAMVMGYVEDVLVAREPVPVCRVEGVEKGEVMKV